MASISSRDGSSAAHSAYCDEWTSLFDNQESDNFSHHLKTLCLRGRLQGSHFRSVCWKIFLGCLSKNKVEWSENCRVSRENYEKLKLKYNINPRLLNPDKSDLPSNNPLSLLEGSAWHQYFIDTELQSYIRQDVERTFPELQYFQSDTVREMMIQILFIFARENSRISYKQGMHEILGPLIFVLYSDQQALDHALEHNEFDCCSHWQSENLERRNLISNLINHKYLEHDAYQMFLSIMQIIQDWYCYPEEKREKNKKRHPSISTYELFSNDPENQYQKSLEPTSVLVLKLNFVGGRYLQNVDPILFSHLENLDIPPQIYGIRWLRLLFGREFPIQDLLYLWDAIFAFGPPFRLVDCIFVSMLCFIRDLLLNSDYTGCLHYLMRYPPVTDVQSLLAFALHLMDPKTYERPPVFLKTNFWHITVAGRPHPNLHTTSGGITKNQSVSAGNEQQHQPHLVSNKPPGGGGGLSSNWVDVLLKKKQSCTDPNNTSFNQDSKNKRADKHKSPTKSSSLRSSPTKSNIPDNAKKPFLDEEKELLKEQVSCLQYRLNEVESVWRQNTAKILALIDMADDELKQGDSEKLTQLHQQVRQLCIQSTNGNNSSSRDNNKYQRTNQNEAAFLNESSRGASASPSSAESLDASHVTSSHGPLDGNRRFSSIDSTEFQRNDVIGVKNDVIFGKNDVISNSNDVIVAPIRQFSIDSVTGVDRGRYNSQRSIELALEADRGGGASTSHVTFNQSEMDGSRRRGSHSSSNKKAINLKADNEMVDFKRIE